MIAGKYDVSIQSPIGVMKAELSLIEENGTLTGSVTMNGQVEPISAVVVDGSNLSFDVNGATPMGMFVFQTTAVVGDGTISGSMKMPLATMSFSGTRI